MKKNIFVFDFDSTVVSVESFDELIFESLKNLDTETLLKKKKEIENITNQGMEGIIDLKQSLSLRIKIANINQNLINIFNKKIVNYISKGIVEIIKFLHSKDQLVFILSGGFLENIYPVVEKLNIKKEYCFANNFIKEGDDVVGIDFTNPLSTSSGKIEIINKLKKVYNPEKIFCIGDGVSDLKPFQKGIADYFLGFGQNKVRDVVKKNSKHYFLDSDSLFEFLRINENFYS